MEYVIMISQFVLSLSILIVLHEMGHFIPAKAFGTRVEKFFLFFDPGFALFKKKIGETEYGVGWLPLGGYVKISGMIDESMDREQMKQPPQPWEFRSKPAWQRLIIMLGGVTVNFLLGFLIFGMIFFVWGEEYLPNENVKYGIQVDSLGMDMGLRTGDHVLAIGEQPFERFSDRELVRQVIINNVETVTVKRDGREQDVSIDPKFVKILAKFKNKNKRLFVERVPFVIGNKIKDSPADTSQLEVNDSLIAFNGQSMFFFDEFHDAIQKNAGQPVTLTVVRNGSEVIDVPITPTEEGIVGVHRYPGQRFFETRVKDYSLLEALPAGTVRGWNFLVDQIKAFGQILTNKIPASESLGGFASIGSMFGTTWEWDRFWTITAILSLILAFMNLLPIPALDGGHVMFLLYEVVSGRKPSDKFMEYATLVGFVLIIALLLYANGLDIMRGCS